MSISSQIIEVVNDLCAKFGIVVDWTADNVVPRVEELVGKYISWEVATSKMWIAIGVIMVVVSIVFMIIEFVARRTDGMSYILLVPLAIVGVAVVGNQVYDILTCVHFSEKQVFEYIQMLMRSR